MRQTLHSTLLVALLLVAAACAQQPATTDGGSQTGAEGKPGRAAGEQETEELVIGLVAPNQVYSAVYVAVAQGWFEEEGFEPFITLTQSSTGSVQQAAAGSVHLAAGVPDAAVLGIKQGAPVSVIAVAIEGSPLSVVGRKGVGDWEELRGQTIGVSALKGGEIALLRRLLAEHGLAEGDYDVIVSGPTPAKTAALKEGSVAAAVLFSPSDFVLETEGFQILGNTAELALAKQMPLAVYMVNEAWAQENDRAERVARVLVRANEWLQDPANRDEAVRIFSEAVNQPPEHVASTYQLWFDELDIGTTDGAVTADHIEPVLDMLVADGDLSEPSPSPDEFIDPEPMEQAREQLRSG